MKKNIIIVSLIVLGLLILAGAFYSYKQASTLVLQGEVEVRTIDLSSKIPARIKKINVIEGSVVKKGDVLIELDTPEIQAKADQTDAMLTIALAHQQKVNNGARNEQIAMAKANYDVSLKTYNRLKRLHSEGVIPTQKLDEATAQYLAAKENYNMLVNGARNEDRLSAAANVQRAKGLTTEVGAFLKENRIVAPIDGVVTEITVDESELVGAGYPIVSIVDNNDTWVTFNIREDLLKKFKIGTEFEVRFPAVGDKPIKVKVNYISVLGNFATWRATKSKGDFDMKTFELRAIPTEKVENLRAGMSVLFDWKKLK